MCGAAGVISVRGTRLLRRLFALAFAPTKTRAGRDRDRDNAHDGRCAGKQQPLLSVAAGPCPKNLLLVVGIVGIEGPVGGFDRSTGAAVWGRMAAAPCVTAFSSDYALLCSCMRRHQRCQSWLLFVAECVKGQHKGTAASPRFDQMSIRGLTPFQSHPHSQDRPARVSV